MRQSLPTSPLLAGDCPTTGSKREWRSTVSREIGSRHGGRPAYRRSLPNGRIVELGTRPCDRRSASLRGNRKLRDIVASKLILVTGRPSRFPALAWRPSIDDESLRRVERIYRSLFIQARGVLNEKSCWTNCARSAARAARAMPVPADSHEDKSARCRLHPRTTCGSRRPSDSGPLGRGSSVAECQEHLRSATQGRERHSRFAMLIKVPSKNTEVVVAALSPASFGQTPRYPETLADLGSIGDGQAQRLHA